MSRPTFDLFGERGSLDELHDERAHGPAEAGPHIRGEFFETVNLGDVRVIQGRKRPGLTLEPGNPIWVSGE